MHYEFLDTQTRLRDRGGVETYSRGVRVVDEAGGLSTASHIEIVFDPAYQSLAMNHLEVVRDGKRLDRLDPARVQLLQRETQLERQMVDGRKTLSIVVDDVRVGDRIDYAYTLSGNNPVFGGRYVDHEWMTSVRGPAAVHRLRVLAPPQRAIVFTLPLGTTREERTVDGLRETVLTRSATRQLKPEPSSPGETSLAEFVQASEFPDWASVVDWGRGLFVEPAGATPLVDRAATDIAAQAADPAQRLLLALDLVQKQVRYFGTEGGAFSHQPAPPERVLQQRFGDCKDKVSLLLALLRRMDIHGEPVLVSTALRGRLDRQPPGPLPFDHVIARVEVGGTAYWLDATRNHQTGTLAARQATGFGRGLLLVPGQQALATLPSPLGGVRMSVDDHVVVSDFKAGAELESRITYRDDLAELVRESLAVGGAEQLQQRLAEPYLREFPQAKPLGDLVVEPSTEDDAVTLVRRFAIAEPWRFMGDQRALVAEVAAWNPMDALRVPATESRKDAYAIGLPGRYRQVIRFDFPEDVVPSTFSKGFDDGDSRFALHTGFEVRPRGWSMTSELDFKTDLVAAADWPAYTASLRKAWPRFGASVAVPLLSPATMETTKQALQKVEADVRSQRVKPATMTQVEAMMRIPYLDAVLAGGRLSPSLRAQALVARGIQHDHLRQLAAARQDFAEAIALTPESGEALDAAATNALSTGDLPGATAMADRAMQQNARDPEALRVRSMAQYLGADYAASSAGFGEMLQDREQLRRGYPVLWATLARQRAGKPVGDDWAPADLPSGWPRPLIDLATGKLDAEGLLRAAKEGGKGTSEKLCEAYFYLGERADIEGDASRARSWWQKAVDLGVTEFLEDGAARVRLGLTRS